MKNLTVFCCLLCLVSCHKTDILDPDTLFADLTIDDKDIAYTLKDSLYSDGYFTYPGIAFECGGGFLNDAYRIDNVPGTVTDQFILFFINIPFESITTGSYPLIGSKSDGTRVTEGVKLTWMDPETWDVLEEKYYQSETYLDCHLSYPGYNCLNNVNETMFMTTSGAINDAQLEISKAYYKLFESWSCADDTIVPWQDLVIEGSISNCRLKSSIDTSITKTLSGNFRIHLPSQRPVCVE